MSFLLLKSRSGRPPSYRSNKGSPSDGRANPPVSTRNSGNNGKNVQQRFTSKSGLNARGPSTVQAGGGQVQLHRPATQQKRQISSAAHQQSQTKRSQQHQKQQPQQQQQRNDIISMDEVMEDLRVLEQQQRDSQRLLASIKLSKQHKLEQRSTLDNKLSALKYSNGEARAQLIHAREVLSKSTRDLANTKLRSERSGGNLKRFDHKLKKALAVVRALHTKRRKLDHAIVRLHNADDTLNRRQTQILEEVKIKNLELDDANHREQLLLKSIQAAKMKAQGFAEDTVKMRSELSGLESDLTSSQQMEASTKFRAENIRSEIASEIKRHDAERAETSEETEKRATEKMELERRLRDLSADIDMKRKEENSVWEECVAVQKEERHEISSFAHSAILDMTRIQSTIDTEKTNVLQEKEASKAVTQRIEALEKKVAFLKERNECVQKECETLVIKVKEVRKVENNRATGASTVIQEFETEHEKVKELDNIASSLQTETETFQFDTEEQKEEMVSFIAKEKGQLVELTIGAEQLDKDHVHLEEEIERQQDENRAKVEKTKMQADEAKKSLDTIQKRADEMAKAPSTGNHKAEIILNKKDEERLNDIRSDQAKILKEYPCLASLDLSYDAKKSKENQIECAVFDLRAACDARVEAAREAYKTKIEEKARIAEERVRVEAEENARLQAQERERLRQEELARIREKELSRLKAVENARLREEEDARVREKEEAEERERLRQEELEHIREKELIRLKAVKEALLREEEEARIKVEEEERLKEKEEVEDRRRKQEEKSRLRTEKARLKAKEEARIREEKLACIREKELSRLKAIEETRVREEEARLKVDEEARLIEMEEADVCQRKQEVKTRLRREKARLKMKEEARIREKELTRLTEEDEARLEAKKNARHTAKEKTRHETKHKLQQDKRTRLQRPRTSTPVRPVESQMKRSRSQKRASLHEDLDWSEHGDEDDSDGEDSYCDTNYESTDPPALSLTNAPRGGVKKDNQNRSTESSVRSPRIEEAKKTKKTYGSRTSGDAKLSRNRFVAKEGKASDVERGTKEIKSRRRVHESTLESTSNTRKSSKPGSRRTSITTEKRNMGVSQSIVSKEIEKSIKLSSRKPQTKSAKLKGPATSQETDTGPEKCGTQTSSRSRPEKVRFRDEDSTPSNRDEKIGSASKSSSRKRPPSIVAPTKPKKQKLDILSPNHTSATKRHNSSKSRPSPLKERSSSSRGISKSSGDRSNLKERSSSSKQRSTSSKEPSKSSRNRSSEKDRRSTSSARKSESMKKVALSQSTAASSNSSRRRKKPAGKSKSAIQSGSMDMDFSFM